MVDYVKEVYESSADTNIIYDVQMAEDLLEMLDSGVYGEIPMSIEPEEFMEIWNNLVLTNQENQFVETPQGRRVQRWALMTDKQMATVIKNADSWEDVEDLIMHLVDEDIFSFAEEDGHWADGWDCEVIVWCEEVLSET